jgi:hypothetical protein
MSSVGAPRAGQAATDAMSPASAKWNSPRISCGKKTTCEPNSLTTAYRTGPTLSSQARWSTAAPGSTNSQNSMSLCSSASPCTNEP